MFLYPDWWINENIGLLEERERVAVPNFPPAEIVASRIDAIVAFDRTADLPNIRLPTLVICAKDDILTPPYFSRELAWLIPNAALIAHLRPTPQSSTMPCLASSPGMKASEQTKQCNSRHGGSVA